MGARKIPCYENKTFRLDWKNRGLFRENTASIKVSNALQTGRSTIQLWRLDDEWIWRFCEWKDDKILHSKAKEEDAEP
jgi:hypothetical protein